MDISSVFSVLEIDFVPKF